jgi:signal peptidase I
VLIAIVGLAWIVGVVGWETTAVRAFVIPSASMAPAIRPGDRVTAEMGPKKLPERGEIWIVHMPRRPATGLAIKRVIGLPGETVEVKAGQVWINGRPLKEPYLTAPTSGALAPVTLGPEQYFLMGDNRGIAQDCRVWGPLPKTELVGRVNYRFWPPNRLGGP